MFDTVALLKDNESLKAALAEARGLIEIAVCQERPNDRIRENMSEFLRRTDPPTPNSGDAAGE